MSYTEEETKAWARETMHGVCNVIMPSFSADLKRLNEKAIRHDVRRCKELGFWGSLAVSECGTTTEEYLRFIEVAVDEGGPDYHVMVHGTLDTIEDVIEVGKAAAGMGADTLLLSYPPSFYPRSEEDVYKYSMKVMDEVPLATILFSVSHWNFSRLHPADLSPQLVARLADHPRAVALKCEGNAPGNAAHAETMRLCGDKLLISDPREATSPGHVQWFGMPWMGTSVFQYYGDAVPRYFKLMHEGRWEEAMEIYWKIQPARAARAADGANYLHGAMAINRQAWKYMEWLNGFNGGALRVPTMRISDASAKRLADAVIKSGIIEEAPGDLGDFYAGRNPI